MKLWIVFKCLMTKNDSHSILRGDVLGHGAISAQK